MEAVFTESHEQKRAEIIRDNKSRFTEIIAQHETQGASSKSTFIAEQLPPLDESKRPYPDQAGTINVEVVNGDTFVVAREMMDAAGEDAIGKTAVLNMASDEHPGGGWERGSIAQEECLCYSSTLFHTLTDSLSHYPWPNSGPGSVAGIYSPGVVVFRGQLNMRSTEEACPELPLEDRKILAVLSVAAPRFPPLTSDRSDFKNEDDRENLKEKVRLVLRMAAWNGQRYVVLGAMGCGAYFCPPSAVAELMKGVLLEEEFFGWFRRIVFAVFSSGSIGMGNFGVFSNAFEGVRV